MTREEREDAINFFKEVAEKEVGAYCKLAIEALEQQPCEDCISRQEAINCVTLNEFRYKIVEDMKTLPSVTPKEKTGHWIRWYETIEQEHCTIHDPHCKCSECNQEYDPYIASLFNYCPNCGCHMVEPQESEDKE